MSYTHSETKFALIDCNNFYVSCERIFNPLLERKPVVVLSNNDGCVISRSNEAKALKIAMAVPLFQIKSLIKQHQVQVLSSNYTLYGDISQRVMYVLATLWPKLEVYSIDEAFLDLQGLASDRITVFSHELTQRVQQWTGIPITLGSGPTKTLAKVANYFAKKRGLKSFDLSDEITIDLVLARIDVAEVWGVGYRWAKALGKVGVRTALDLKKQDPLWIRNKFNKILSGTVLELQGIVSTEFEEEQKSRKSLVVSRSFAKILKNLNPIKECLAHHVTRAAEKLRAQAQVAQGMTVFIQTSRFDKSKENYHWSKTFNLPGPTDNTSSMIHHALSALTELYQENRAYTKVGIMLYNLSPKKKAQLGFWQNELPKGEELMIVLDKINKSFGRNTLHFAASLAPRLRAETKSPCYTTNWQQLPIVQAGGSINTAL